MSTHNNSKLLDTETYIDNIVSKIVSDKDLIKSKSDKKCAPGVKFEAGSCAKLYVLVELAKAYNVSAQPADQIRLAPHFELLNPQKYKRYLVYEMNQRMKDTCTHHKCWSKQEFIKNMNEKAREEFTKYTHRPDSPQGKFDWLSTFDINDTMAQYERVYKDFRFLGAVPMDFADLPQLEVAHIDYDNYYKKGIRKLGIVFNSDDSNSSGSHWISLFFDMNKGNIFYFDSFAVRPERRVRALMRQQARFLQSKGKKLDDIRVDYNKKKHQQDSFSCGTYAINYLVRMARGDDFDQLCNNPPSDEKLHKCRLVYFDKHVHQK
jgi:hypothetical protein